MNKVEISKLLSKHKKFESRTIVIIDFANVDKWQYSLGWKIGIKQLSNLTKQLTSGKKYLRRFYYGLDYGKKERGKPLDWSNFIAQQIQYGGFTHIAKPVKYIHDSNYKTGYVKKCNLDIEMAVDLISEVDNYDSVFVFSGDGDLSYVYSYLHDKFSKRINVFVARDHVGKEIIDAKAAGIVKDIFFVEDFEYRLNWKR